MSKFNTTTQNKTTNLAGGEAYRQSPELELISILTTSFVNDKFYRTASVELDRLKKLIEIVDKLFVAKAAVYTRNEYGMRSISHVVASELAKHISGETWAKDFYKDIVRRPDDMLEIVAYHKNFNGKLTNAMKKGFSEAVGKFDAYQLAKYRGEGKDFKLVDLVNLVHPTPTEKNAEALKQLIEGTLKSTETWEAKLTDAGKTAKTEEEKADLKESAWADLVLEGKIGYFALLKNLRNIIEQSPKVVARAIELLQDRKLIKNSLVLPFRYLTAAKEIAKLSQGSVGRDVLQAINNAIDIAVDNVPKFKGETLVVLDTSGSMTSTYNAKGGLTPAEIGALLSAVLVKSNNADFMTFDHDARYQTLNPNDTTVTMANSICFPGGATNFRSVFQRANRKYDRIIILSDMQGWVGYHTPKNAFNAYKESTGANPMIYSFDLQGYGSLQFAEQNVFTIAGFSEKVFDTMALLETDKNALLNTIKEVSF